MSVGVLLALPLVIPLVASLASFFFRGLKPLLPSVFLLIHLLSCLLLAQQVFQQGAIASTAGAWLAPYGITLVADPFAALMLSLCSFLFSACLIGSSDGRGLHYWPLLFLLQTGVSLSFLSGDLFNLFVAFELMLLGSYALMVSQIETASRDHAYSYLSMNVMASFFYLIAIAMFYSYTGQLNLAAISQQLQAAEHPAVFSAMLAILLVLLVKAGIFPFYFWMPDSYPFLPSQLGALFSGVLSKVGVYVLFRLVLTVFPADPLINQGLFILSALTMVLGVMGAVARGSIPGILSYHTLSQVGYILMAMTLSTPFAIAAAIYFMLHNMVVKASLFLIGGIAERRCGSSQLALMGGLWTLSPFLGILFILQAFSLAGLPPFSGFWGKYLFFLEGMTLEAYWAVALALITSFFTLASMVKIWNSAFLPEREAPLQPVPAKAYMGAVVLTLLALFIGLLPQVPFKWSEKAAAGLLDTEAYQKLSLGAGRKG